MRGRKGLGRHRPLFSRAFYYCKLHLAVDVLSPLLFPLPSRCKIRPSDMPSPWLYGVMTREQSESKCRKSWCSTPKERETRPLFANVLTFSGVLPLQSLASHVYHDDYDFVGLWRQFAHCSPFCSAFTRTLVLTSIFFFQCCC